MNHRTSSNSSCLAKTNRGNPEWTYFNQKINWWILLLFCFMLYDFCCVIKLDDPLRHSKAYPIYRSVPVSRGYRVEFPREQTFKSFRGARLSAWLDWNLSVTDSKKTSHWKCYFVFGTSYFSVYLTFIVNMRNSS